MYIKAFTNTHIHTHTHTNLKYIFFFLRTVVSEKKTYSYGTQSEIHIHVLRRMLCVFSRIFFRFDLTISLKDVFNKICSVLAIFLDDLVLCEKFFINSQIVQ